jgi:hypothetical protein
MNCRDHPQPPPVRSASDPERRLAERLAGSIHQPDRVIDRVIWGDKFVGLQAGDRMGLASALTAPGAPNENRHPLEGARLADVARLIESDRPADINLGLAAINAGLDPPPADSIPAHELIAEWGRNAEVALVGHFPFVDRLRPRVGRLHVLELGPSPIAAKPADWDRILDGCAVLALTATTILTRYMHYFLTQAPRARIIILGPSTPLSPVLFDYGADCLAGSAVTDPDRVADGLIQGLPFYQLKKGGIRFVSWMKAGT